MTYSENRKELSVEYLTREQAKKEAPRLIQEIRYHNDLYYGKSRPADISDSEYDELMDRYEKFKVFFLALVSLDSVGKGKETSLSDIPHSTPMGSVGQSQYRRTCPSFC